jgi:hypothetical protein
MPLEIATGGYEFADEFPTLHAATRMGFDRVRRRIDGCSLNIRR